VSTTDTDTNEIRVTVSEMIWDPKKRPTPLHPALYKSLRMLRLPFPDTVKSFEARLRKAVELGAVDAAAMAAFNADTLDLATVRRFYPEKNLVVEPDDVEEYDALSKSEYESDLRKAANLAATGGERGEMSAGPAGPGAHSRDGGADETNQTDEERRANTALQVRDVVDGRSNVGTATIVSGGAARTRRLTGADIECGNDWFERADEPSYSRQCPRCGGPFTARLEDVPGPSPARRTLAGGAVTLAAEVAREQGGDPVARDAQRAPSPGAQPASRKTANSRGNWRSDEKSTNRG